MWNDGPLRLASIDIGSNADHLVIGQQTKASQVRVLIDERGSMRLGQDAGSSGYIHPATQQALDQVLDGFLESCEQLNVHKIKAVGTSALRHSRNSQRVI